MNCWACAKEIELCEQGIPIYEDIILHNGYKGEWGGVDACKDCFHKQQLLTKPVERTTFLKMQINNMVPRFNNWSLPDAVMRRALEIMKK